MKNIHILLFSLIFSLLACDDKKEPEKYEGNKSAQATFSANEKIDLNQDLSQKSLAELRLLRNRVYARQGYCFMAADLRGYFTAHMPEYDSLMNLRWWAEEEQTDTVPPISFTKEETAFIKKIEALENKKRKENFITRNGLPVANIKNIINLFQFTDVSKSFMEQLDKNSFVIIPGSEQQLFHLYEGNDYKQVPNFVTTDLYLQLYHMYFSYLLKTIEREKFVPILTELTAGLYNAATALAADNHVSSQTKELAEFSATFYAIPYYILTGKKNTVPPRYASQFEEEITHINEARDNKSEFLGYTDAVFPYSLYKPRGHYTRDDTLKKYFKAMMWLQTASFCRTTKQQLTKTVMMAHLLRTGKSSSNKSLTALYQSIYDPIVFLVGESDNLSVGDLVSYLSTTNYKSLDDLLSNGGLQKINANLEAVEKNKNKIKPKIALTCESKINFMPQRYLMDNEILLNLVDIEPDAERAFPKGLDLFAALGNQSAEDILMNEEKEGKKWTKYPTELKKMKDQFAKYTDWNKTVYNKWIETLLISQKRSQEYPSFMQTIQWDKKNLNTSLASWTDLKHDASLYGEQPQAAECGGGGPPDPITVGYVEPNIGFWKNMLELITLTEKILTENGLMTDEISGKSGEMKTDVLFLLSASQKELKKQKLSEQEYKTIEIIGSSVEYLTLSIMDGNLQYWENVKGPDRSVAVVADIYTRNVTGCKNNGILHEAVGNVNEIFVVVEIEGYLYLTRGATFSYYEFVRPLGTRLTDEEWQEILEKKKDLPPIPKWMEEIILPAKDAPVPDEKVFYSSGC